MPARVRLAGNCVFRTNTDEWVTCGPSHPLRFETEAATGGLKPYVHVRADLWARATRAVWLDLVELGEVREIAGLKMFGVVSAGEFYAMAPASILLDDAAAEPGKLRPGLSVAVHVDERRSTGAGVDERPSMPVRDNDALALSVGDARQ